MASEFLDDEPSTGAQHKGVETRVCSWVGGCIIVGKAFPDWALGVNTLWQAAWRLGLTDHSCFKPEARSDYTTIALSMVGLSMTFYITVIAYLDKQSRKEGGDHINVFLPHETSATQKVLIGVSGFTRAVQKIVSFIITLQSLLKKASVDSRWAYLFGISMMPVCLVEVSTLHPPNPNPPDQGRRIYSSTKAVSFQAWLAAFTTTSLYWVSLVCDPDHLDLTQDTLDFMSIEAKLSGAVVALFLLPLCYVTAQCNRQYLTKYFRVDSLSVDPSGDRRLEWLSAGAQAVATTGSTGCLLFTGLQQFYAHPSIVWPLLFAVVLIPPAMQVTVLKFKDAPSKDDGTYNTLAEDEDSAPVAYP